MEKSRTGFASATRKRKKNTIPLAPIFTCVTVVVAIAVFVWYPRPVSVTMHDSSIGSQFIRVPSPAGAVHKPDAGEYGNEAFRAQLMFEKRASDLAGYLFGVIPPLADSDLSQDDVAELKEGYAAAFASAGKTKLGTLNSTFVDQSSVRSVEYGESFGFTLSGYGYHGITRMNFTYAILFALHRQRLYVLNVIVTSDGAIQEDASAALRQWNNAIREANGMAPE